MVAKINRGVSLYGAVIYNQRKVDEATARIIAGNRMITDLTGNPHNVMQQTLWAFESYLAANRNTEKPVLHISLNPSTTASRTGSSRNWHASTCRRWATATSPTSSICTRTSTVGMSILSPPV